MISVLSFVFMVLLPGYLISFILFGKKDVSHLERAAISIIYGISSLVFVGVVLGFDVGWFGGLTLKNLIIGWLIINLLLAVSLFVKSRFMSKRKSRKR